MIKLILSIKLMKNKNSITFSKKLSILACEIISEAKTSHIGSVLSIRDILSVLFCDYLQFTNKNIITNNRNRLILSKGHAGAGVYSALYLKGFITKKQYRFFFRFIRSRSACRLRNCSLFKKD